MTIQLIISADGSHTLLNTEMNETYHSTKGALQESLYVFIEKGLDFIPKKNASVKILEIGFGTGLNALLTLEYAVQNKVSVEYHTLEPYPLSEEIIKEINYPSLVASGKFEEDFKKMHRQPFEETQSYHNYFSFTKYLKRLEEFESGNSFDLIYYDAFAPSKQPEVWALDNLKKIFRLSFPEAILVTYCANGQFKRDLKAAGFTLETLQGPPGKKEMTRGKKDNTDH